MRPGSTGGCGRDQGSAEDCGGPRSAGGWKQSQAVDIRATEFLTLANHRQSVPFFAILGAGDLKNFNSLAQTERGENRDSERRASSLIEPVSERSVSAIVASFIFRIHPR